MNNDATLFTHADNITITVVGDLMLDRYICGNANRLSGESPVPIVLVQYETENLGGAGNVVANLRGLGANVNTIGVVGSDQNGKRIAQLLNDLGCGTKGLIHSEGSQTITKTRVMAQKHQIVRFDCDSLNLDCSKSPLLEFTKDAIDHSQILIISDYQKGTISENELSAIIDYANKKGIPSLVDPKTRDFGMYRNCSCIKPNSNELQHGIPSVANTDNGIYQAGLILKHKYNIGNIDFRSL